MKKHICKHKIIAAGQRNMMLKKNVDKIRKEKDKSFMSRNPA